QTGSRSRVPDERLKDEFVTAAGPNLIVRINVGAILELSEMQSEREQYSRNDQAPSSASDPQFILHKLDASLAANVFHELIHVLQYSYAIDSSNRSSYVSGPVSEVDLRGGGRD